MPEYCTYHRVEKQTVPSTFSHWVCGVCISEENYKKGHTGHFDITQKQSGFWVCDTDCKKCKEERITKLLKKQFHIPSIGQVIYKNLSKTKRMPCGAEVHHRWHSRPGNTRPGCGGSTGDEYSIDCKIGSFTIYSMFDGGYYTEHYGGYNNCSENCPIKY